MEFLPDDSSVSKESKPLSFSPAGITRCLGFIIMMLLGLHLTGFILGYVLRIYSAFTRNLIRYFDFNLENNFPAWFSVMLLAFAALLLFIIYAHKKTGKIKSARYWLTLGLIFVFMSIDECIQIHEHLAEILRPKLSNDLSGLLYWSWVVVYAVFVLVAVVYFLRFVLTLPLLTRKLFFLSGILFVTGALALELLEGYFFKLYGVAHIYNLVLYTMEELLEMSGVTVFIYALLDYIRNEKVFISIGVPLPAATNIAKKPTANEAAS